MREALLQQPRLVLVPAPVGDVAEEADEMRRVGALHTPDRKLAREETLASLRRALTSAARANDARLAGPRVAFQVRIVLAAHTAPASAFARCGPAPRASLVAEHALGGEAELPDRTLVVDHDHRVDGRVEERLTAARGERRCVDGRLAISSRPMPMMRGSPASM